MSYFVNVFFFTFIKKSYIICLVMLCLRNSLYLLLFFYLFFLFFHLILIILLVMIHLNFSFLFHQEIFLLHMDIENFLEKVIFIMGLIFQQVLVLKYMPQIKVL